MRDPAPIFIAIEGAVDRFCGRPRNQNPYARQITGEEWDYWDAWDLGWADADHLLDMRGQEEAARWLREAAA